MPRSNLRGRSTGRVGGSRRRPTARRAPYPSPGSRLGFWRPTSWRRGSPGRTTSSSRREPADRCVSETFAVAAGCSAGRRRWERTSHVSRAPRDRRARSVGSHSSRRSALDVELQAHGRQQGIARGESVDEVAFLLGHRDANVTRAVYVRELADARRRSMRRSRMIAEFGELFES